MPNSPYSRLADGIFPDVHCGMSPLSVLWIVSPMLLNFLNSTRYKARINFGEQ